MGLGAFINTHPRAMLGGSVGFLIFAMLVVGLQLRSAGEGSWSATYYWDLEAEEEFVAHERTLLPIEAPSGGAGVQARLFTCGECNEREWFGYLEVNTDRPNPEEGEPSSLLNLQGHFVRDVHGSQWFAYTSAEGQALIERSQPASSPCGAGPDPKRCEP